MHDRIHRAAGDDVDLVSEQQVHLRVVVDLVVVEEGAEGQQFDEVVEQLRWDIRSLKEQEALDEVESAFRFNDAVLRHMTIRMRGPITEASPLIKAKDEKEGDSDESASDALSGEDAED